MKIPVVYPRDDDHGWMIKIIPGVGDDADRFVVVLADGRIPVHCIGDVGCPLVDVDIESWHAVSE